jgi:retron-type reverse transcriptase
MEGRGLTKGHPSQQNALRAQNRDDSVRRALARVREVAERDKGGRFTTLLHHIYDVGQLRAAYHALKRDAAPGIDGETWEHYGEAREANLADLSGRLARGAYRAKPVRRAYIAKADGRQRPLGIPTREDKIVQRTTAAVLNAIYETDFLGFSYGFRPRRNPHHALDALYAGLLTRKVNWVLDADIRGFFEAIDHKWLVKFIEHRIADQRVVRWIQKWLNADCRALVVRQSAVKAFAGSRVSGRLTRTPSRCPPRIHALLVHQLVVLPARGPGRTARRS